MSVDEITRARDGRGRLTVGDILSIVALPRSELLAGGLGLDRTVSGVNIIEVPDVGRWLRGGEFLLTAGYAWHNDPGYLPRLIAELNRVGASGMGIKFGPYLRALRPEDLRTADDLRFPIVRLPPDMAYMDVMEPLYQRLTAPRLWLLERSSAAQQALLPLGLDDQSMSIIVENLARQLRNPTWVIDLIDNVLVSAEPGGAARRTSLDELDDDDRELLSQSDRLGDGRVPVRIEVGNRPALTAPLVIRRRSHGRVVVVDAGGGIDDVSGLTLSHGAEMLSFLLMQRIARLDGRREVADIFLTSLLSDRLSGEEAAERALTLGLRLTRPCAALLVSARVHDRPDNERMATRGRVVEKALAPWPHVTGDPKRHPLLAIIQVDQAAAASAVDEAATAVRDALLRAGIADVVVATGSPLTGAEGVRRSRSEALIALQAAQRGKSGIVHFADLGVERVLSQIPVTDTTRDYLDATIGPVAADAELLRTLEVFLECGCKKVAAAAAIPLHRSSLEYRLEKISRLLSVDLDDPERILELWLALRMHRMLGVQPSDSDSD